MNRAYCLMLAAAFAGLLLSPECKAQPATALTGIVSSDAEGRMEGVLVSAKGVGGTITLTVVSDKNGRYAFPADRLRPGQYNLSIRATGYDASKPDMVVTVGEKSSEVDLKLVKAADVAKQLTLAEWLESVPGTEAQKDTLYGCVGCHASTPIFKSTYDAEGWKATILRMRNYEPCSSLSNPMILPYHNAPRPKDADFAQYLSTLNLSGGRSKWNFEFKPLPRPKGKATKVIVTEYDLPRSDAEPHDALIDGDGMIWYDDFAQGILGRLDPRTGETKEWKVPQIRAGFSNGSLNLALDREENPWLAREFQAGVAKFDKKTEKFTSWSEPAEYNNEQSRTTFLAISPDGTVWFDDTHNRRINSVNPETGQVASYPAYPGWKPDWAHEMGAGGPGPAPHGHSMYGMATDSKGTVYWADIAGGNVGVMDPWTHETKLYPTPTVNSGIRRLHMDPQDKLWFGENFAFKIGVFDTNTKQFKEWADPLPWDAPYDAVKDKAGYVWTGGWTTDFVTRLDPKTDEITQYLLPSVDVNIRRVEVDNLTNPPSFLIGENHQAKIALVQPMD
jgi:streptogramin lyase